MTVRLRHAAIASCVAIGMLAAEPLRAEVARLAFGAAAQPSPQVSEPIGGYSRGCLAGGIELAETAARWQAMRLSRNRNWGHPDIIAFIERLSVSAEAIGWPRIFVGDISQPRGGPMLSGHRSHQIGLDADIWLRRPGTRVLSRAERERISSTRVVAANGRDLNASWSDGHHALLRAAARDAAVARIFVNPAIKRGLCRAEPPGDRAWLRKIRPWWGHDAHFHVRLRCPPAAPGCRNQDPPPPGDGCGAELASWFQPPAPSSGTKTGRKRRELRMADLPAACRAVLR